MKKGWQSAFIFKHTCSRKGLSAGSILRIVLDTCQTTDEAIQLMKKLPHAWSYDYSMEDTKGQIAVNDGRVFLYAGMIV
ncbi:hypothetical protein KFZ56_17470 [Virgibacillus sp. NKC19-3]|uniref:carcinine hydrolase/isopenicillin-N N-acyltransferase family protein n=1 Tax=Virgibacillus saliphilus TaxID=2831674 RepID=UPI001C9A432A|nr:carcinine hydrolase/isopenicillin-N N-acyltransferase family protein [Virgibacillus sp. NKC19-3]MBY7144812.1 hypothetical protein [Virgibacillus sp. NKC19-3]